MSAPASIRAVAGMLLGEPNRTLSTRHDLRYRGKGSLSIEPNKDVWRDYEAGAAGGVLGLIAHINGGTLGEAYRWLVERGLAGDGGENEAVSYEREVADTERKAEIIRRKRAAAAIWRASFAAKGSLVETYLASRGLRLPEDGTALRFHPRLEHRAGGLWPTMVALVSDSLTGKPLGIHRTYLARDGSGKAPVEPNKMTLGPIGGGVVRLAGEPLAGAPLLLGEGVETTLTGMQATGHPGWCAVSAGNIRRSLELPDNIKNVILLEDGDAVGRAAVNQCALRLRMIPGRRVRIAHPPAGCSDFNDAVGRGE